METMHKFEKAGLGLPPYRLVEYERKVYQACQGAPIQPGTVCDYCSTAIMDVFWILSADGKKFKVGSDCVKKAEAGNGMTKLWNDVERAAKLLKKKAAAEKLVIRVAAAMKIFNANPLLFTDKPHPSEYYAGLGKTFGDYIAWCFKHDGASGLTAICKLIEKG